MELRTSAIIGSLYSHDVRSRASSILRSPLAFLDRTAQTVDFTDEDSECKETIRDLAKNMLLLF